MDAEYEYASNYGFLYPIQRVGFIDSICICYTGRPNLQKCGEETTLNWLRKTFNAFMDYDIASSVYAYQGVCFKHE